MRYHCGCCGKSVSSELPNDSIIRAFLVCPECIGAERILFPELPVELPVVLMQPSKVFTISSIDEPSTGKHGTFTGWDPKLQRWIGPDACPSCSGYGRVMEAQHGQSVRCERCGGKGHASNTP